MPSAVLDRATTAGSGSVSVASRYLRWMPDVALPDRLTLEEDYLAMFLFFEDYWEIGRGTSSDIANLLGGLGCRSGGGARGAVGLRASSPRPSGSKRYMRGAGQHPQMCLAVEPRADSSR